MKQVRGILIALGVAALAMSCGGRNLGADGDSGIIAAAVDNTPPANITGFTVQPAPGRLILSWTNPPDADFAGVRILRKTTNDITDQDDTTATVACGGNLAAPQATCTDTGLTDGTTYYYKIFSYDAAQNYATGVAGNGTPACGTIEDIRSLQLTPGTHNSRFSLAGCTLPQVTVTMVHRDGSNMGFYIQQTQGGAGIFVFTQSVNPTTTLNLTPGDRITFAGSLWPNLCVAAFNQQLQIVKNTNANDCGSFTAASFTTGDFNEGTANANYLAELATTVSGDVSFSTDFVNGAEGRLYVFSTPVTITGNGDANVFPASFGTSTTINVRKTALVTSLLINGAQFTPGRAVIGRFNSNLEVRIYGTGAGGTINYDGITPGGGENGFGIRNLVDNTPPTVSSTTPANGATGVALGSSIAVTFSEAMNTGTVTAQTAAGACSGSVQVSLDNFSNCIAMSTAAPTFSGGNTVATFTPATALTASTTYKIRVTTAVQDAAGNAMATQFETATGFTTGTGGLTLVYSENFEGCTKVGYAPGAPTGCTSSNAWNMDDVLVGTTAGFDRFNGTRSARFNSTNATSNVTTCNADGGMCLEMTADVTGAQEVRFYCAKYGIDTTDGILQLQASTDGGSTWTNQGATVTCSGAVLTQYTRSVSFSATPVRFRWIKTNSVSTSRTNVDDIEIYN